jgi:hypothetical protein
MHKTFIINGGAGRVISATSALEKFARLNPENDFRVVVHGWQDLYWSHPVLQHRTVGIHQKNVFEDYVKHRHLVCPEPYNLHDYYNQRISLAQAFDREINPNCLIEDLPRPKLYVSSFEKLSARRIISEFKQSHKKNKVVVFQPYGSGMQLNFGTPFDSTHRSISPDDYLHMAQFLNDKDCLVFFFGPPELRHPGDNVSANLSKFSPDLRMFLALIHECDYFIGCDSVGQHMAYCLNKPGSVFMGSTFEINVSYPSYFRFFRRTDQQPVYSPLRLGGVDGEFADRQNDGIMNLNKHMIGSACEIILKDIYYD